MIIEMDIVLPEPRFFLPDCKKRARLGIWKKCRWFPQKNNLILIP